MITTKTREYRSKSIYENGVYMGINLTTKDFVKNDVQTICEIMRCVANNLNCCDIELAMDISNKTARIEILASMKGNYTCET